MITVSILTGSNTWNTATRHCFLAKSFISFYLYLPKVLKSSHFCSLIANDYASNIMVLKTSIFYVPKNMTPFCCQISPGVLVPNVAINYPSWSQPYGHPEDFRLRPAPSFVFAIQLRPRFAVLAPNVLHSNWFTISALFEALKLFNVGKIKIKHPFWNCL